MPQVPAGNVTGLYYIIVAGLPWSCPWHRLKDFASNQKPDGSCIEIDHALVYPGSTDGWVRVKGKKNFKEALAHLNIGVLEHRSIIADGRNETETVNLRDMAACRDPSTPRRHRNKSSAREAFRPSPVLRDYHTSPTTTYAPSEVSTDMWYLSSNPSSSVFSQVPPRFTPTIYYAEPAHLYDHSPYPPCFSPPSLVYPSPIASQTPIYIPLPPPVYAYTYPLTYPESPEPPTFQVMPPPPPPSPSPSNNENRLIRTEARKLIITSLPPLTTRAEIHSLISHHLYRRSKPHPNNDHNPHEYPHEIENIGIVQHADHRSRGHAFVVLESHAVAKKLVELLDGTRFQGKILGVRFAKEGVETPKVENHATRSPLVVGHSNRSRRGEAGEKIRVSEESGERREEPSLNRSLVKEEQRVRKWSGRELRTKSCEPGLREREGWSHLPNTPLVVSST